MFEEVQPTPAGVDTDELQAIVNRGANWFFWIAGLTLVNSVLMFTGSDRSFAIGLGITQIFDGVAHAATGDGDGSGLKIVAFALDIVVIAIFVGFGLLGRGRHLWAFVVGMVLFGLDTLIYLMVFDVIGIAIHALAIFFLFQGFNALRELNTFLRNNPAAAEPQT